MLPGTMDGSPNYQQENQTGPSSKNLKAQTCRGGKTRLQPQAFSGTITRTSSSTSTISSINIKTHRPAAPPTKTVIGQSHSSNRLLNQADRSHDRDARTQPFISDHTPPPSPSNSGILSTSNAIHHCTVRITFNRVLLVRSKLADQTF